MDVNKKAPQEGLIGEIVTCEHEIASEIIDVLVRRNLSVAEGCYMLKFASKKLKSKSKCQNG